MKAHSFTYSYTMNCTRLLNLISNVPPVHYGVGISKSLAVLIGVIKNLEFEELEKL